jgi:myo-inositol-1(or 4)-monophosphatase
VRRFGATSLALCDLAAGRLDGYWHYSTGSWDVAAGGLIAEEAGAVVSNIDGTPLSLTPPCSIAAANPQLHANMLSVFNEPRGKFEIN